MTKKRVELLINILQDPEIQEAIESNQFNRAYTLIKHRARPGVLALTIGALTDLLLESGINPLLHMNSIPTYFAYLANQLRDLIIPQNITYLSVKAFNYCEPLRSVKFEGGITELQMYAFASCPNLISVSIPRSVNMISSHAFWDCPSLERVYYDGTVEEFQNFVDLQIDREGYNLPDMQCSDGLFYWDSYDGEWKEE